MYLLLLVVPAPAAIGTLEILTGQQQRASINLAMSLGVPLAFLMGAAAGTVLRDRQSTLQDLRERVAESTWDSHLGQLHRRSVERDAATYLHNTVQSRMTAAAIQLQLAVVTSDQPRADAAIANLREAIVLASSVESGITPVDPRIRFTDIAKAWQGFADVTIDLPELLTPVSSWRIAADVVDECVTNAIRHGRATHVYVVGESAADDIGLSIIDNGTGIDAESGQGLGRNWMSGVATGTWTSAGSEGGTRVDLRIPHPVATEVPG
jgi:signal transduction histidine kinase